MLKNILILLLTISTAIFAYIAIRNSTPLECTEVIRIEGKGLCIIDMDKLTASELEQATERLMAEKYKYINEE